MFYKFITFFLLGIAINILWDISMSFILFISCLLGLYVLYIKDTLKDISKDNVLYGFIVLISFLTAQIFLVFSPRENYIYNFKDDIYKVEGVVLDVSPKDTNTIVSLEVTSIENMNDLLKLRNYPKYINLSVSPLYKINLYDNLSVTGEIEITDFQNSYNSIGQERNLLNNNFEKLFLNTKYNVSDIKTISINNQHRSETLWLKIKKYFYETSKTITGQVDNFIKDPYLGIAKGVTYGDQDSIVQSVKLSFIDSGLIHIMVLSGANVSFIILILFYLLNLLPKISQRVKVFSTVTISFVFVLGTGLSSPSLRAAIMVNTNILAEYFSKNFKTINSLLLSLFVLTLINPYALLYSPSLHLSYLAICGLLYVSPFIYKKINKEVNVGKNINNKNLISKTEILNLFKSNFFKVMLSTFLGILISIGPYLLSLSGQMNLFGVVASILLEPIILLVTVLTFLITFASFISEHLALIFGIVNSFFISIILFAAEFLAKDIFTIQVTINSSIVQIYYFIFLVLIYYTQIHDKKN